MKQFFLKIFVFLFLILPKLILADNPVFMDFNTFPEINAAGERRVVIVICSYNNNQWYQRNLDSVFMQKYSNYYVLYVDDCSSDGTADFVQKYIDDNRQNNRVKIIKNSVRRRALANLYSAIHQCNSKDIVVILDGDDWLAHNQVLSYLNNVYSNPNVWLTYGQFKEWPSGHGGFCAPYPSHIIQNNAFRTYPHGPSHLRTFYAGLFHKIKKEDLMYQGDFFPMTYDLAIMLPMMEMAGSNFQFVPEVLLIYNSSNPINDHKTNVELQHKCDRVIRSMRSYSRITTPF